MSAQLSPMFSSRRIRRSSCPHWRRITCATTGKTIDCNVSTASATCWCVLHPVKVWQRGAWLNAAITQNNQHSKSRLIPHSTALTPGLIFSFVLPWFSAKTSPWHSWHVCVPGDWRLLSGGKKAVNKIKQKCILAYLWSVVTATYNHMLCRLVWLLFCNWLRLRGTIIKTLIYELIHSQFVQQNNSTKLDGQFFFDKICTGSSLILIRCLQNWIQTSFTFTKHFL